MGRAIDLDKAIEIIEEKQKELCPVGRYGRNYVYGSDREKYDAWEEIIDALNALPTLPQPSNEPLTLEELREMDGEPAFVPETNCWVLVTQNPVELLFTFPDGEKCSAYYWYERVGPAYRRPPEGEEDT